jgi:glycerol kinase
MSLLLAIDQGTTSSRAMVFDADGKSIGMAQKPFAQHFPQPGRVEHDALEIWAMQRDCVAEVLGRVQAERGDAALREVRAVGITNQRETTVLWDRKTGRPLAPAIVWQDRRTADHCERLRAEGRADDIRARTGLEIDAYFSASKLAWLLDHLPDARRRAEAGELAFGTIDSWLVWNLTGGRAHLTDASNASRTMLFNLSTGDWDETLLALFGIPRAVLPAIVDSSGVVAHCDPALFGLELPIAGIAGDQQAATFGQACFEPGMAKNTYGTGCFLMAHVGWAPRASTQRLLSTVGWRIGGATAYMQEGSVFVAGALVQWLRDGLGIIDSSDAIEALAASVPDSAGVVVVPAFTGLGAPHWDPYARGSILGLTRGSTRAHIARASLEAIALQNVDLVSAMARDGIALSELRVDGGAARNDLLMQMQADLLGVHVVRPAQTETTALGAAYLAGLGVGVWSGLDEIASHWRVERRFEPAQSDEWRTAMRARWEEGLRRAKEWERDAGELGRL